MEKLGIERSLEALEGADLVLVVVDLAEPDDAGELELILGVEGRPCIVVGNKTDLIGRESARFKELRGRLGPVVGEAADGVRGDRSVVTVCEVSARTGEGVEELRELIGQVVGHGLVEMEEPVLVGERQRLLVGEAAARLDDALAGIDGGVGEELVAEDLRASAEALGRVTGEEFAGDLLEEIFGRFCGGK